QALCLCYHERWEVEETIDETRNQQRLSQQPLRSRWPKLVLQEFYALLLAHYAVRCLMWQAAQSQGLDPDRISFTGAIQVLGRGLPLRRRVGASGERMWWEGPGGRPSAIQSTPTSLFEMYWPLGIPLARPFEVARWR